MSKKINYNTKKNKNNGSKTIIGIITLISILLCVYLIYSVIKRYNKEYNTPQNNIQSANYNDSYSSIDDLLKEYNIQLLNHTDSTEKMMLYVRFDRDLFEGEKSNQKFFSDLCDAIAKYIEYKNFELIDENRDIDIDIKCENPNIVQFMINGDNNYFLNKQTEISLRKTEEKITQFTIQSSELQALINSNWKDNNIYFGTKESTVDGYNIFFDEGIYYKTVATRVFNIIFTSNYTSQVAGGLRVGATQSQVISALGEPTFSYNENVYGYKGENNYLFFDFMNNQISCYRTKEIYSEDEGKFIDLVKAMNETNNVKQFVTDLISMWIDYDTYEFDNDYVDLRYTLRGINLSISNNSLENGIFIYQNYPGNKSIVDYDNVYLKDTDSVFEYESQRSTLEKMNRADQGDFDEEYFEKYLGIDYSVKFNSYSENKLIGPRFYSRDSSNPDSELDKRLEVSSFIWFNEYIFIYSVDNDGIYAYNCNERFNQKLIDINEKISINDIVDGQLKYNNTEVINLELGN